jgi:methylase of polypeptide subunit release factors
MSVETIVHEPSLALYWWKDTGFELYEQLISQIIQQIKKGFLKSVQLYIEIWFDQKEYSENYLKNLNLDFQIHKDNSWIHRCVQIGFDSYLK